MAGMLKSLKEKTKNFVAGPDNTPATHTLSVHIVEGRNLVKKDLSSQTDPYCIANIHQDGRSKLWNGIQRSTKIHYNSLNPTFNESFPLPIRKQMLESLHVRVFDKDQMGLLDRLIGEVYIPLADLMTGMPVDRWYDLVPPRGGQIHLVLNLSAGWSEVAAAEALKQNAAQARGQPVSSYPHTPSASASGYPTTAPPAPSSATAYPQSSSGGYSEMSGYPAPVSAYPTASSASSTYPATSSSGFSETMPLPSGSADQPSLYPPSTAAKPAYDAYPESAVYRQAT